MKTKSGELRWKLGDVWPEDRFEELYKEIEKEMGEIERWWKKLDPKMDKEEFKKFIDYEQELGEKISRLGGLPGLMETVNQKDSRARLMKSRVNDLLLKFSQKTRKFGHWLKGLEVEGKKKLEDGEAKRLFEAVPDLEYNLNYARLAAKHTLGQKEEDIIDHKDVNGIEAVSDLRGLIESDFEYKMGEKKIKTQGELLKFVYSNKAKDREEAYRGLLEKHKDNREKLWVIYQAVVKDWGYETRLRGYSSPIGMRNFGNRVTDKTVEVLLKVCREERKIFWRFFKYKAKQLKKEKLSRFDLYAPIGSKINKKITLEEARILVKNSFKKFSERFSDYGEKVFVEQHIDSHPRKNKRSGAFCATISPKITPYVLLNQTNTIRDVATLAHELGHAIHSLYAQNHYPDSQQASLPLAETASTLGEMILFEEMMARENDPKIKKQMLAEKLGDLYATILRQNYFVMFEIEAHKLIEKGTTVEEISKIYWKNLKDQFGEAVKIEPIFKYEWLYISHIFESPFYCYAYSFGELLTLALYARYKKEGKSFITQIEKLLEAGGSKDPAMVLKEVGIEMESEDFWKRGFEIVRGWVEKLEN